MRTVRIHRMLHGGFGRIVEPRHRAHGIEIQRIALTEYRYGRQIVCRDPAQIFGKHPSTITEHTYLGRIGEAIGTELFVRKAIHSTCIDTYLDPMSRGH